MPSERVPSIFIEPKRFLKIARFKLLTGAVDKSYFIFTKVRILSPEGVAEWLG
jgi:hypothetical protein